MPPNPCDHCLASCEGTTQCSSDEPGCHNYIGLQSGGHETRTPTMQPAGHQPATPKKPNAKDEERHRVWARRPENRARVRATSNRHQEKRREEKRQIKEARDKGEPLSAELAQREIFYQNETRSRAASATERSRRKKLQSTTHPTPAKDGGVEAGRSNQALVQLSHTIKDPNVDVELYNEEPSDEDESYDVLDEEELNEDGETVPVDPPGPVDTTTATVSATVPVHVRTTAPVHVNTTAPVHINTSAPVHVDTTSPSKESVKERMSFSNILND